MTTNAREIPAGPRIGEKDLEDLNAKAMEIEQIDKEFKELLEQISADDSLEKYRFEYEKLYKTFRMSFENEKRLVKQCKDLNDMIVQNAASVKAALDMSEEDSNTIKKLRKEIEKAWSFVEKAKEKEDNSKKMVQELKSEINHLNEIVKQGAALSLGSENDISTLMKSKESLSNESNAKTVQIEKIEAEIVEMKKKKVQFENQATSLDVDFANQKEENLQCQTDNTRKDDKINHQEEQHHNISLSMKEKEEEHARLTKSLKAAEKEEEELKNDIAILIENTKAEKKISEKKITEEQTKQHEKRDIIDYLNEKESQIFVKEKEEKITKDTISELEKEKKQKDVKLESLKSEHRRQEKKVEAIEKERNVLLNTVQKLERDLDRLQKEIRSDRLMYYSLVQDNVTVETKVKNAEKKNTKNEEDLNGKEDDISNVKKELEKKKKDFAELQKQKEKVDAEKGKLFSRVAKAQAKVQQLQEECKLKDNLHTEIERKMMEYKEKAKEKEQLYEVVRSDRNLYSKNLIEKHDEMNELKRKFDITTQQINQLKEELEAKDKALVSRIHEFEQEKQEKEKNAIQVQAQEMKIDQLQKAEKEKDTMIKKLTAMLKDGEAKIKSLQKDYEKAIRDKDVFGTELIRRNDELTLLCEKLKFFKVLGSFDYNNKIVEYSKRDRRKN